MKMVHATLPMYYSARLQLEDLQASLIVEHNVTLKGADVFVVAGHKNEMRALEE